MTDEVLTKTFSFEKPSMVHGSSFILFPKPIKKKSKTMADYAKKQRVMPLKSTKKSSRIRLPSITSIKKKAWNVFSLFIRARDKKCVLCGSVKGFSAGHLIPRGKASTKFDENNVFGLCSTCNFKDRFEPGYHDRYVAWYFIKFGAGRYLKLVEKSQQIKQMKRNDFLEIIKKYENKPTIQTKE